MKEYQRREKEIRDEQARLYESWYLQTKGEIFDHIEKSLYSTLVEKLKPETVLDVGCGTGRITLTVAPHAKRTFAIDYSEQSLSFLRAKVRQVNRERPPAQPRQSVTALLGDATEGLNFDDSYFDLIASCQVLQHMKAAALAVTMNECLRVLKPKGIFAFSVYNLDFFRFNGNSEDTDSNGLYFRRYSAGDIASLASAHGFTVREISYYRTLPSRFYRKEPGSKGRVVLLDRTVAGMPIAGKRLANYLFAILVKEGDR